MRTDILRPLRAPHDWATANRDTLDRLSERLTAESHDPDTLWTPETISALLEAYAERRERLNPAEFMEALSVWRPTATDAAARPERAVDVVLAYTDRYPSSAALFLTCPYLRLYAPLDSADTDELLQRVGTALGNTDRRLRATVVRGLAHVIHRDDSRALLEGLRERGDRWLLSYDPTMPMTAEKGERFIRSLDTAQALGLPLVPARDLALRVVASGFTLDIDADEAREVIGDSAIPVELLVHLLFDAEDVARLSANHRAMDAVMRGLEEVRRVASR